MRICIVIPGGLDPEHEDRRIPCLESFVERVSGRHSVDVFALRQTGRPEGVDFAGARVHALAGQSLFGAVGRILRAHQQDRFDVVHAFWVTRPGVVGLLASRVMRRPLFVHAAGGEFTAMSEIDYGTARTWKGRTAVRGVSRRASVVTVASSAMARLVEGIGVHPEVVPLGVDLMRWPIQPPPALVEAPYRLIHVASLNRVKNQTVLLQAMAKLNSTDFPFHLDIVGVDTLDGELQQLATRLRLTDVVTFHGWLPQADVRRLMRQAHLHVVTSLHEAGPLVVREAAACGVVTVGTPVGHVEEWAPEAAISVATDDGVELAAEIRRILRDDDRRVTLATIAQARTVERDMDWTVAQFERLYDEHRRN